MAEAPTTALDEVTWDLSHLLDGERAPDGGEEAAVDALLDRAEELAEIFARAYEGHVEELDGPGLIEAMKKLAEISELAGRAANYAHLRFAADTEAPANGALLQRVSERGTAIQTKLLFFELEWVQVPDARAEELLATEGLEFCAPLPADGAPLPAAPPLEARGDDRHRALGHRARRLDPPIRRAHLRDPRRARPARTSRSRSTSRCPGSSTRTATAPSDRRGGHRRPRAGAAHPRLRLQHAPPGQGDQGPAALVPALARLPQPLQRGVRRVRAGAGRGGEGALRPGSPLVRDQGEAARARPPRRLRPDGRGHRGRRGGPVGGRAGSGDRLLLLVLGPGGGGRRALLRASAGSTPRPPPSSAAAPSAPRPSPRSTPTCCSTTPASAGT